MQRRVLPGGGARQSGCCARNAAAQGPAAQSKDDSGPWGARNSCLQLSPWVQRCSGAAHAAAARKRRPLRATPRAPTTAPCRTLQRPAAAILRPRPWRLHPRCPPHLAGLGLPHHALRHGARLERIVEPQAADVRVRADALDARQVADLRVDLDVSHAAGRLSGTVRAPCGRGEARAGGPGAADRPWRRSWSLVHRAAAGRGLAAVNPCLWQRGAAAGSPDWAAGFWP